jgi:4-amino-4-deoxy-L-arabinose transferase-like glycosyltransferase
MWAALSRQWRAPFRFLHPLIIAVFCATALSWYVLCASRNPDFLRVFLWQHNFERYLTPVFEHRQPFWFFGYILLLAVFPWILFLCVALFDAFSRLKNRAAPKSIDTFFACWALFPVIFFSLSQSKLPGYILPAIPPLFVLLGHWVSNAMALKTKSVLRVLGWTGASLLLTAIPLTAAVISGIHKFPPGYVPAEVVVFLFGIVIVVLAFKSRPGEALLFVALFVTVTVEIANFALLPGLDKQFSARQLAGEILKTDPSGGNVAVYRLPSAWKYGMDFYLNRDLPEWAPGSGDTEWILGGPLSPGGLLRSRYEIYLHESRKFFIYHRM